jgi:hypothetical protein
LIQCTIPTYDSILKVHNLKKVFEKKLAKLQLEKDYVILAYACFDLACTSVSLEVTFGLLSDTFRLSTMINDSSLLSSESLLETLTTLTKIYSKLCTNGKTVSTMNKSGANASSFNECLAIYGFECTSLGQETIHDTKKFTFELQPIN